jgi:hypothetical protein
MLKRLTVYSLPDGTDGEEFWKYHTQSHAVDCMKASGQWRKKYVINRVTKALYGKPQFFGLIETWWQSEEAMEKDMEALRTTRLPNSKTIAEDFSSQVTGAFSVLVEEFVVKE